MSDGVMTGRARMLAALRLERVDRPPAWFMRQAGRHLPGYRALRERASFLDLCRDEELCAEASSEPWRRYGVDGAIVFNDILIPLRDMGIGLEFDPGPRLERLIATEAEAEGLTRPAYGPATDVCRCIGALRGVVGESAAVLGFIGAPFTVAAFAVAGPGSGRGGPLEEIVRERRAAMEAVQERLLPVLVSYAMAQAAAGADVIQVFESLAGEVDRRTYREVGLPCLLRVVRTLRSALAPTPVIVFGRGLWPFMDSIAGAEPAALSLGPSRPLAEARRRLRRLGLSTALQGNLAGEVLREEPARAARAAEELLARWASVVPLPERSRELGPTGWVFNLGHGVPADARPESVLAVAEAVRGFRMDREEVER